jgi:hypothetical protein
MINLIQILIMKLGNENTLLSQMRTFRNGLEKSSNSMANREPSTLALGKLRN